MKTTGRARGVLLAAVIALIAPLAACSSDEEPADSSPIPTTSAAPDTEAPDAVFGAACAELLPAEGPGSRDAIATQPAGMAIGSIPALSGVFAALQAAQLVESLDSQRGITVLAPVDSAFAAVPPEVSGPLMGDTARLTATLTHHVVQGRVTPGQLAGTHTTLNNDALTVEGSGEQFTIPAGETLLGQAPANVVCGNVQTANATLYLVDQVLVPTAG